MRSTRFVPFLVLLPALLLRPPAASAGDLDTLVEWMTGSFSSAAQAAEDSTYFDIRLEMVPIWTDRVDGRWLYVEQAAVGNLEKPYRQRVYQVTDLDDGAFRSEVYSLPDPLKHAGEWRAENPLADLSPDDLSLRKGCAVFLHRTKDAFQGGTDGTNCESTLRGASYATSEVTVLEDRIESWDRGFDENGAQTWGAEAGPYVFDRIPPNPPSQPE